MILFSRGSDTDYLDFCKILIELIEFQVAKFEDALAAEQDFRDSLWHSITTSQSVNGSKKNVTLHLVALESHTDLLIEQNLFTQTLEHVVNCWLGTTSRGKRDLI